jgi:hypothetical protein
MGNTNKSKKKDYEYAPTRSERKKDDWNDAIAKERKSYYQQILDTISTNFYNLQAYNLSIPRVRQGNFECEHSYFYVSIVVAQTPEKNWLCLAPTTPNQVTYYAYNRVKIGQEQTQTILSDAKLLVATNNIIYTKIQPILYKITPITLYGYYHGAYNYTYQHRIIGAVAQTKAEAIALALQKSEMVFINKLIFEDNNDNQGSQKLSQFMHKCLRDRTLYDISFWDIGYTYHLGKTPVGDWIGAREQSEFQYNP